MKYAALLALTVLPLLGSNARADGCDGILSLTRSIDFNQKSIQIASQLRSTYCEGSSLKSGASFDLGLDVVIEQIPIGLKAGSNNTKEKLSHLCSTYDSWYAKNSEAVSLAVSTSDRAIEAWRDCKLRKEQGVFFTVNPQKELIGFGIRRGANVIDFLGMDYLPNHITCFGPFGENGQEVIIDKNTRSPLTSAEDHPITCRRKVQTNDDGLEYLAATEISIEAQGAPSLIVPLPREEKYEPTYSSQIADALSQLQNNIDGTNTRVDGAIKRADEAVAGLLNRVNTFANGLTVKQFIISYGETPKYQSQSTHWVGCGSMNGEAAKLCSAEGGSIVDTKKLFVHSGDRCGYALSIYICLKKTF